MFKGTPILYNTINKNEAGLDLYGKKSNYGVMGRIIKFPGNGIRKAGEEKKKPKAKKSFQKMDMEELIVAELKKNKKELIWEFLGEESGKIIIADSSSFERFVLNWLINKFKEVRGRFKSYVYISRMLSRFGEINYNYVVDMLEELEVKGVNRRSYARIGDTCFVMTSLFPEWIERRGSEMKREDYGELGSIFYMKEYGNRRAKAELFVDLAKRFMEYSDAVLEARNTISSERLLITL
ncbi:MAG: hypothetical protein D6769_00460 [Methanobacteriota archaeon]|nr:MAG: hypothetical protein D6769_00460 [Euryarchaeota archaeon]